MDKMKTGGCLSLISFFLVFNLCITGCCYGNGLCVGKNATLDCLRDNFDSLYSTNYSDFWSLLREAEKKAVSCKSTSDTAAFLKLAHVKNKNAEFNEYLREIIEKLATMNPKCFLDSLSLLDTDNVVDVIALLKNPIFIKKQKIAQVFSENKYIEKYKRIMDIYFGK